MVSKCANASCSALFHYLCEGKLFCAEVELENGTGHRERKTHYFWLCSLCCQAMKPTVHVNGSVVTVRLSPITAPATTPS